MEWIKKILIFAFCSTYISIANANTSEFYDGIHIKRVIPTYSADIERLFIGSIENAYKVNAQIFAIKSEQKLYNSAKYYYIPTANISSEVQKKFNHPGHPSPFTEFKLNLSATMKVWSDTTGDQKDAAYHRLIASKETYNNIVNGIYFNIKQNIIKIELAREFLNKSEQYRIHMNSLLEQMNVSSQSGLLKKSDRLFADVSIKKFEESILNVESQIEQYKNQINNVTPANLYKNEYGVSPEYIEEAITLGKNLFNIDIVTNRNFNILSKRAQLSSDRFSAEAYNENFNIDIVTMHGITEHDQSNIKDENNKVINGYTYDNDGQAYIGLKMTYTGLNYQNYQQKSSEFDLFNKKVIELDELIHQTYVDLDTQFQQYTLIKKRIENVEKQIKLTLGVINSMMNEMRVDESNILDIFRNISSLSDLEMNRLSIQNELVDLTTKVKSINSIIPSKYVIN